MKAEDMSMPWPAGVKTMTRASLAMYEFACRLSVESKKAATEFDATAESMKCAMGAVIHAATSLEAMLNEEIAGYVEEHPLLEGPLGAIDRLEAENKWVIAPQILFGRTLPKGAEPFQSFGCLNRLRNWLVHYKPRFTDKDETIPGEKALRDRFAFTEYPRVRNPALYKVLNPACARWACGTAREMALAWTDLTGNRDRRLVEWEWSSALLDGKGRGPFPVEVPSIIVHPAKDGPPSAEGGGA